MRWLVLIVLIASACGDSAPRPTPTTIEEAIDEARQNGYNDYLALAREDVQDDADLFCDPSTWEAFLRAVGDPSNPMVRFDVLAAVSDACIEIGRLDAQFSRYHANAP